jgi:uncharacterized protein (DUF2249 family)
MTDDNDPSARVRNDSEQPRSRSISVQFTEGGERIAATLLDAQAPATCDAIWKLAALAPPIAVRHVIFTGRELGSHIPLDAVASIAELKDLPPENQSVFPAPGDLMFQYCPPYQFAGDPNPVYDLSICYGPDTRLFMPWGWSPANRFASVRYADRGVLAAIGARLVSSRADTMTIRQHTDTATPTYIDHNCETILDARSIEPALRHTTIFATYASLAPGTSFVLMNDHDPKSLYYHFAAEHDGEFAWEYLERGPSMFRIRIGRKAI